jgi:hypothetical protein
MSWLRFTSSAGLLLPLAPLLLWSCGSSDDSAENPADSGVVADVADTRSTADTMPTFEDTGPVRNCTLDNGTDPFGLCVQKVIFRQWHEAAFVKALGVAESWDSVTFLPDKGTSGETLHRVLDDVGYAAALARYRVSAFRYGDTEMSDLTDPDLADIATRLEAELVDVSAFDAADLPELYVALRAASGGYRSLGLKGADTFDTFADKVGAAIYATYHPLAAPPPGDAGADASDDASDASTDADVGDALPPIGDGVLGAAAGSGYAYSPADAITGAYALLDMAARHAVDKSNAYAWQRAAVSTIEHVHARAREATTGMYYRALIATDGAATDTLPASPTPNDVLLADVQATIALSLSRAQEVVTKNKTAFGGIPAYPFDARAAEAITNANGTKSLWDEAGTKGYFEGFIPSTGALITTKPTRANARFLAALHRVHSTIGTAFISQLKPLRIVLTARTPEHSGLLSTLPDQASFLERAPASFDFGTTAPSVPRERSYFSRDDAWVLDALWEQWFGLPV